MYRLNELQGQVKVPGGEAAGPSFQAVVRSAVHRAVDTVFRGNTSTICM